MRQTSGGARKEKRKQQTGALADSESLAGVRGRPQAERAQLEGGHCVWLVELGRNLTPLFGGPIRRLAWRAIRMQSQAIRMHAIVAQAHASQLLAPTWDTVRPAARLSS